MKDGGNWHEQKQKYDLSNLNTNCSLLASKLEIIHIEQTDVDTLQYLLLLWFSQKYFKHF